MNISVFLPSLRGKLIFFTVLIEILIISMATWNSQRLAEEHLLRQFELRRGEITLLLQAALVPAMAQRDYASVSDTLLSAQKLQGMTYLVMLDAEGQRIAMANFGRQQALPKVTPANAEILKLQELDLRIPIEFNQRKYGELQLGIDLNFLRSARQEILFQNIALGLLGIFISSLLIAGVALWLTQRLGTLRNASLNLASGHRFEPIEESSDDDLGMVARAFNNMASTLQQRMHDLQDSETEQRSLAIAIDTERGRLDALLAAMRIGLVFVSHDNKVAYINPSFEKLWAIAARHIAIDQPLALLLQQMLEHHPNQAGTPALRLFSGDGTLQEILLADGRIITQHSVPVLGEGGRLWLFEDVTSERQTAERLRFMAERDPLTGLANRNRFDNELNRQMAQFARDPSLSGALLYFDIDEFKYINDNFGHRAGDSVLVHTADAVSRLVRNNELLARLGGDEFVILAPDADLAGAQTLAERIVRVAADLNFDFDGRRLGLTISLGIALFPEHASSAEELVSRADAAMYQAKHSGKNCWRLYRPDLDQSEAMLDQLGWNEKIQRALDENRLVLHYQGIHEARNGRIAHYEALVRMIDPENPQTLLFPNSFIPAAERTGRIVDIDRWVMRAAIEKLANTPALPALAINISARSFDDPSLARTISTLLEKAGVAPQRLIIELTETSALSNMQDSERFISDIRAIGCTVCLDDFGVGFSSFAYLKHLSANVLKIDGMFITGLLNSKEDQVFVRAIVDVARGLGKKTVAEFVGDAETLQLLAQMGVDYVQGYYLSRPIAEICAL